MRNWVSRRRGLEGSENVGDLSIVVGDLVGFDDLGESIADTEISGDIAEDLLSDMTVVYKMIRMLGEGGQVGRRNVLEISHARRASGTQAEDRGSRF